MSTTDTTIINRPAIDTTSNRAASTSPRKGRPTVAELRDRHLPTDRLWTIEDVAACLQCSVREAEVIVKDPGVPQPRLSRGRLRRWSPAHWHAWMEGADETYVANSTADDELELGTV